MKKLLIYLALAVVSLLSVLPQVAQATPYDCTQCKRPFDIQNALYDLSATTGFFGEWDYTEDPMYPLSDNNEAAWTAVTWSSSNIYMPYKPDWSSVSSYYTNDNGYDRRIRDDLAVNYYPLKEDVVTVQGDIAILTADVVALEATLAGSSVNLGSKTYQAPTFSSATTATQLSASVEADVFYAFDAVVTISLLAGQSVTAVLKYADDSGMSSNVVTVDSAKTANSGVLGLTQTNTLRVGGKIPAGKYRQVTFTTAGSGVTAPTTIVAGQEAF